MAARGIVGCRNQHQRIRARTQIDRHRYALNLVRIVGGSLCYIGQIVGSLLFFLGYRSEIYVASIALIVNFYFLVSGSWLLVLGTSLSSD